MQTNGKNKTKTDLPKKKSYHSADGWDLNNVGYQNSNIRLLGNRYALARSQIFF